MTRQNGRIPYFNPRFPVFCIALVLLAASCSLPPDEPPKATALPVAEEDVGRIGSVFGINTYDSGPRFHGGIDFNPKVNDTATFFAVADGVITTINRNTGQGYDGDKGARNYRIEIALSSSVKAAYHFEAALNGEGVSLTAAEVDDNIFVQIGERVSAGQAIGTLPYRCESTHVDFGIVDKMGIYEGMPSIYEYFDEPTATELRALVALFSGL